MNSNLKWCNFFFLVFYSITMIFLYHLFALVITTPGWKGIRCPTLKQYSKQKWWFSQPVCKAFYAQSSTDAKKGIVTISIPLGVQQKLWTEMLYKILQELKGWNMVPGSSFLLELLWVSKSEFDGRYSRWRHTWIKTQSLNLSVVLAINYTTFMKLS